MKKIITLVTLMLVLLMAMCAVASAGDDHAEVTWNNPKSARTAVAIDSVSSSISKASSTSVSIKAKTVANQAVNSVGGKAVIQRWNNNTWETYKTYNFNAYGSSSCSLNKTVTVASGYNYRLRVSHSAVTASDSDYVTTTTSSVKVP